MKSKIIALLLVFLFCPSLSWAAGTCTQEISSVTQDAAKQFRFVTFSCTADSSDGSFPSTAISTGIIKQLTGWYLYKLTTNPGATPPTDNWDFTITDIDGIDVLGGSGTNRHTTTSQMIAPQLISNVYGSQPVMGNWTLAVTGNSVNSAVVVIKAIFVR